LSIETKRYKEVVSKLEVYSNVKRKKIVEEKLGYKDEGNIQNNQKHRENTMSFGPFINEGETKSQENKSSSRELSNLKIKIPKDDEGNLSLVSYEETDSENDKHYNEEELTSNMGIIDLDKIKLKAKADKGMGYKNLDLAQEKSKELKKQVPKHQNDNNNPQYIFDEDEDAYDMLFDKEMLLYIESLKDKFDLNDELDPREFIKKIDTEIGEGKINDKQIFALQELKRGLQMELEHTPIEIEGELDYESDDSDSCIHGESQYLIYNQINDVAFNPQVDSVFGKYENQDDASHGYSDKLNGSNDKQALMRGFEHAGIEQLRRNDSDQDSKESASKTPCFIGTPTSSNHIGSFNGTGAVKAEDLINAMKRNDIEKKYLRFSSGNSSYDKIQQPLSIPNMNSALSFGGDEINSGTAVKTKSKDIAVIEYSNRKDADEFDHFRT
jgi:hypothetical protein